TQFPADGMGRENSGQGDVGGQPRFPDARKQVGCVAKTHRDAERCVIASSTHPTGFSRPVAAPAFQPMDIQLHAPPTLPVLARTVSGYLNSAFLGLERNRSAVGKTKAPLPLHSIVTCRSR